MHPIRIDPNLNKIQNFEYLLKDFKDYKSCIREIKINTLFGEKCLFKLLDIKPSIHCYGKDIEISISGLSFKIDSNLKILEMKADINIVKDNRLLNVDPIVGEIIISPTWIDNHWWKSSAGNMKDRSAWKNKPHGYDVKQVDGFIISTEGVTD